MAPWKRLALAGLLGALTLPSSASSADSVAAQDRQAKTLKAGEAAKASCLALVQPEGPLQSYLTASGLSANNTFAQYFDAGANPSLEKLVSLYPPGTIPASFDVSSVLVDVGPDVSLRKDAGYGKASSSTAARKVADNGPLGGLPAFCRVGGNVLTSPLTAVLTEIWLPFETDPSIPLAVPTIDIDRTNLLNTGYPTNSTPIELDKDGSYVTAPPYVWAALQSNMTSVSPASPASPSPLASSQIDEAAVMSTGSKVKRATSLSGSELLGSGDGWNGRLVEISNGGQRGFVPLTDMKQLMSRYRFAVAGSNLGHFSTTGGVSWVTGPARNATLLDWASRGTHVSKVFGEAAVNALYGPKSGKRKRGRGNNDQQAAPLRSYLAGCSMGGGRALAAAQVSDYVDDFDGILAGAPGVDFSSMNLGQIQDQAAVSVKASPGARVSPLNLDAVHAVILDQCDELDGVKDGVLSLPWACEPDFAKELLCGSEGAKYGADTDRCLNQSQIDNLSSLYRPTIFNQTLVYDRWLPGQEFAAASFTGSVKKATAWTELVVRGLEKQDAALNPFTDFTLADAQAGVLSNPQGSNAQARDLSPFFNAGKKLIVYHGLSDQTISPLRTMRYWDQMTEATEPKLTRGRTVRKQASFFPVPGMNHCRNGDSAWHFGAPTQNDAGNRPLSFDSEHDVILALIAFVERNVRPDHLVAANYRARSKVLPLLPGDTLTDAKKIPTRFADFANGVKFTRKLCPYPQVARLRSGAHDESKASSFVCGSARNLTTSPPDGIDGGKPYGQQGNVSYTAVLAPPPAA